MKKLLLASAVAALSVTVAQAAPTVYGKVFVSVDAQKEDQNSTTTSQAFINGQAGASTTTKSSEDLARKPIKLNSNNSRIGFKGSESLNANTDVVYQLEYGVRTDDDSDRFTARDSYIGLAHKEFGTLVAGRLSAIDGQVDYANVASGGVLGGDGILASFDSPRANNVLAYFSPAYGNVQLMGMYVMDENANTDSFGRDAYGIGAKYEMDAMRAGATYIQSGETKVARVSGAYDINPTLTAAALFQNTKSAAGSEKALTVSGEYKLTNTPWTAYGQIDMVNDVEGVKGADKKRLVAGGKYVFNANTTGHLYGAYLNSEASSVADSRVAGTGALLTSKIETKEMGLGAGIEYTF